MTPVDVSLSAAPETVEVISALSDDLGTDCVSSVRPRHGEGRPARTRRPPADQPELTTVPGARTIQAPGGTQALRRSSIVEIRSGPATAAVRIPSLLGALIAKACALPVSDHVEDQERDVAVLLTLVDDPVAMRAEIDDQGRGPRRKGLRRLRGCQPLMSPDHRGWRGIAAHDQDVGRAVLQVLLNL